MNWGKAEKLIVKDLKFCLELIGALSPGLKKKRENLA